MWRGIISLFFSALMVTSWSSAHGIAFFEFAPDYYASEGLNIISSDALAEIFIPQNDFLSGVDLWFDNAGAEGLAAFELFDDQNNLLFSKGVSLPPLNPVAGGQRFHLDFPQVTVNAIKKYTLRISSAMPQLQIYYSDRIKFLQHNASYLSEYLNGVAKIGSEEKAFSFKFALYEGVEHAPPVVSNVNLVYSGGGQMRLDFNSNEAVDLAVFWGVPGGGYSQSIPFSGNYQFCGQGIALCSAILQGEAGRDYNYQLTVKDSWGNEKNVTGTFSVPIEATSLPTSTSVSSITPSFSASPLSPSDHLSPIISNLRLTRIKDKSVEIAWQTNEVADSSLLVSFTTERLTIAAANDSTFELEHVLRSNDILSPGTPYLATVTSRDPDNNVASASISFKTLPVLATPTPTPTISVAPPFSSGGHASASLVLSQSMASGGPGVTAIPTEDEKGAVTISWIPSEKEVKEYRIDIFNDQHELARSLTVPAGTKEVKVTDLPDGEYQAVVYANDRGVMRKVALPVTFVIGKKALADKLFALWPYLAGPLVILLLLALRFIRKKRAT